MFQSPKKILISCAVMIFVVSLCVFTHAPNCQAEKVKIKIYGGKIGMTGYVLSFGLADIINANSKKIQAQAVESRGSIATLLSWQKLPEEEQKYIMGYVGDQFVYQANMGLPPFKKPLKGVKAVARLLIAGNPLVTLDPDIKTLKDLAGKRVALLTKNSLMEKFCLAVIKEAAGLNKKDLKLRPMHLTPAADALIDGTIDVGLQANMSAGTDEEWQPWNPNPAFEKLLNTRKAYVISLPEDAVIKARKKTGYPFYGVKHKAQAIGKSSTPNFISPEISIGWSVSGTMPDDIVEEIVRILYENVGKLANYHAQGKKLSQDTISKMPKSLMHPAAVRFYEKKGKTFSVE